MNAIRDIQVLCPMNRGGVGARSLNIELQAALNPTGERKVERFGWTFARGDKVMQTENDYDKEGGKTSLLARSPSCRDNTLIIMAGERADVFSPEHVRKTEIWRDLAGGR